MNTQNDVFVVIRETKIGEFPEHYKNESITVRPDDAEHSHDTADIPGQQDQRFTDVDFRSTMLERNYNFRSDENNLPVSTEDVTIKIQVWGAILPFLKYQTTKTMNLL